MARTFIRQETQIRNSELYDDTRAAGTTLETANVNIEDDLNGVRSQMKRAIFADAAGDWYADIPTVNGKKRAISALNADLDDLEEKRVLYRVPKISDISVPAAQSFVVLSQASSQTPAQTAAVNAGTAEGAVVATLAGDVGSAALTEVSGADALHPKNLCIIVDATTGDEITSSGRRIYGLLQAETGVADGEAFNDTNKQVQLSFVRPNATYDDLEACPSADIAGKTINYSYVRRIKFDSIPEDAFLADSGFIDASASVAVTLDNAIDNQSGPATQAQNISVRISDGFQWDFENAAGSSDLLSVAGSVAGGSVSVGANAFSSSAATNTFTEGATLDNGGTAIRVGVSAGVIDTTGVNDLRILGAGELLLDDGNQTGSTWAQTTGIKLSDTTAEWDAVESAYGGEFSLLHMLAQARRRAKVYANVTANTNADTDVGGVGGGTNLDAQLPDMSIGGFLSDYDVFINGKLLRPGADASANNDYYPGTSLANGQLRFEFRVRTNDVICVVPYVR